MVLEEKSIGWAWSVKHIISEVDTLPSCIPILCHGELSIAYWFKATSLFTVFSVNSISAHTALVVSCVCTFVKSYFPNFIYPVFYAK